MYAFVSLSLYPKIGGLVSSSDVSWIILIKCNYKRLTLDLLTELL